MGYVRPERGWVGSRVVYWENSSVLGLGLVLGPGLFIEADVSGIVSEGVLVQLDETHQAWIVTLVSAGGASWTIRVIHDSYSVAGHTWWEWA